MSESTAALFDRLIQFVLGMVLPGGVVLFAASAVDPTIRLWLVGTQAGDPNVVGLTYALLAAAALGLIVMAVRFCVFEVIPWNGRTLVPPAAAINETARAQHAATYADLRRSYYDFYLAGANLSIAIPCGIAIWTMWTPTPIAWRAWLVVVGAGAIAALALAVGATRSLARYEARRARLLGLVVDSAA